MPNTALKPAQTRPNKRRSFGDVRVVQTRSKIGSTEDVREALRSLRLGRIGRSSVVDIGRPAVRRQIHAVRHLTEVRPLTVSSQFWSSVKRPTHTVIEDLVRYKVHDADAVCVPLSDGASFVVELKHGSYGLTWTSLLPVAAGLARVRCVMDLPPGGRAIVLPLGARSAFDRQIMGVPEVYASARTRLLAFLRLELDDFDLTFEAARLPRHVDEPMEAGEIGLAARVFDRELCAALLETTGAPSVGEHADELADIAANMTRHLEQGEFRVG